jgi:polysaccharide export outer membrane protein
MENMSKTYRGFKVTFGLMFQVALAVGFAQQPQPPAAPAANQAAAAAVASLRPTYVLGANDQVLVRVPRVEDFDSQPVRVDEGGQITLPLIGKIPAAGLTIEQLEQDIARRLVQFVVNPVVSISIVQFRTEPIFLVGAFQRPGIHALAGRRTLLDTLASAGGLQPQANRRIKITRQLSQGKIPLPSAVERPAESVSTAEINLSKLMETVNPAEDIVLEQYDVISASRLAPVYVNGEVMRPGPFELPDGEPTSLVRMLTQAGLTPAADTRKIKLLRVVLGTQKRAEIKLNLADVMSGQANDFPLMPDDVLFVPKSKSFGAAAGRMLVVAAPALGTAVLLSVLR